MVEMLKFSWDEVHEVAEQLEHVHSDVLIERLDQLLGYPKFDPHGDPIPDRNGKLPVLASILLSEGKVRQTYRISGVSENSDAFLKYLNKIGLGPGCQVTILDVEEFDGSMKILIDNKTEIVLSRQAAANLSVTS